MGVVVLACLSSVAWACFGLALPASAFPVEHPAIAGVPAHSELLSVTPADGATLTQPPATIVLAFNEDVNPSFVTVALSSAGAPIPLGAPAVTGATVTTAVPAGIGAGPYRVTYRVVSKDGHPISGASGFTVAAATPATTTPPPVPSTPSATSAPTTSATAPASPPAATTAVPLEPAATTTSVSTVLTVVVAMLALAAGGGVIAWRRRRRDAA